MEFELDSSRATKIDLNLTTIPSLSKSLSYNDFFVNHLHPNLPCIIKDVTLDWEATSKWLTPENKPDLKYLSDTYGTCDVTVYDCTKRYFNSQKTEACKFANFLQKWGQPESQYKYLKDWHLKNSRKDDHFYQVPIYFASDWLNEFLISRNDDDYRFVYIGQQGTWTPFHSDVFNSFSWSANICGRKRWVLFPPGEEDVLKDSLNNLPYDVGAVCENAQHFELVQEAGEAIFVPSGWFHQVWNLEDTVSVNHNWVNGCNVMKMWLALEENLSSVKKEIEDCKDMEEFTQHCQVVLKASFGMDFYKFFEFLQFIGETRMAQMQRKAQEVLFHGHKLGLNHSIFDLTSVEAVLQKFTNHPDSSLLDSRPKQLLHKIKEFLL